MHYDLEIVTDESPERVELIHRNTQKFGTVTNTLARACEVTGTIAGKPTAAPAGITT